MKYKTTIHMTRIIIVFLFCFVYHANCTAQLIIADSSQIAKFYNGSIDEDGRVTDTVNGKIFINYYYLITPYHRYGDITKIQKIKPKMVIGTWLFDTIMPRKTIYPYKLVFDRKHNYLQYDSVSVRDTITDKYVKVERILKGIWKINNDTLYRNVTGCVEGCKSFWLHDADGWNGDIFYNNKIYLSEGAVIFSARRYRRKE